MSPEPSTGRRPIPATSDYAALNLSWAALMSALVAATAAGAHSAGLKASRAETAPEP